MCAVCPTGVGWPYLEVRHLLNYLFYTIEHPVMPKMVRMTVIGFGETISH